MAENTGISKKLGMMVHQLQREMKKMDWVNSTKELNKVLLNVEVLVDRMRTQIEKV